MNKYLLFLLLLSLFSLRAEAQSTREAAPTTFLSLQYLITGNFQLSEEGGFGISTAALQLFIPEPKAQPFFGYLGLYKSLGESHTLFGFGGITNGQSFDSEYTGMAALWAGGVFGDKGKIKGGVGYFTGVEFYPGSSSPFYLFASADIQPTKMESFRTGIFYEAGGSQVWEDVNFVGIYAQVSDGVGLGRLTFGREFAANMWQVRYSMFLLK